MKGTVTVTEEAAVLVVAEAAAAVMAATVMEVKEMDHPYRPGLITRSLPSRSSES